MTDSRRRRIGAGLGAAALALALVTGCNSTDESQTPSEPEAPMTQHDLHANTDEATRPPVASGDEATAITIRNFSFGLPDRVSRGETLTVVNEDAVEHSVTADGDDLFDVDVEAGATATVTVPDEPGTYSFHCTYHPEMTGVLTVE
ncbi:cupredoxin domain-containing protein [Rhodococcus triatomae]